MKQISVIGLGYVGLTTATCFADLGNSVIGVDIDERKVNGLLQGKLPIYEPGLEEMVRRNMAAGRLHFTTDYDRAVGQSEFVFIAVGTPSGVDGEADLRYVRAAAEQIARSLRGPTIIINKSTVPIGTGDLVTTIIRRINPNAQFAVVSNPEFLREGSAISDFMNPDRVVLGAEDHEAAQRVAELHKPLAAPVIITDTRTAEMIKYASNAFLATRISFINEIAVICDELGADVKEVARGMGLDKRIGPAFLEAGVGYGGSCFPKDVQALAHMAAIHGRHPQLLYAVMEINRSQRRLVVLRLRDILGSLDGKTIALLGLSFKPQTDDTREAPALEIAHLLHLEGAKLRVFDPLSMEQARPHLPPETVFARDPYDAATGADALVVVTEWNEFKQLDLRQLKGVMERPVIIDGRNIYDPREMRREGFIYYGIGRGRPRVLHDPNGLVAAGVLGS
ncbi:MAG: UDP-glucose/GDP-mannose dehydrogenase family protein [Chloroflexota bacterium]|nr:UDP-glucose/GDP-mannose dehydrogenase family protein [Dehalococcoidia bacterium]MDW8252274.1 UDP-glucose/GDP-mannose dehydrogenase family protein [Chloroflexota bacterium]